MCRDTDIDTYITFMTTQVRRNKRFSFLVSGYRPTHAWWEAVDMLRKLTMVGLAAAFGKGTDAQLFFVAWLTVAWLSVQCKESPYFFAEDNALKVLCEVVILCTILVGRWSKESTNVGDISWYSTLLLAVYAAVPLAVVAVRARKHCERPRHNYIAIPSPSRPSVRAPHTAGSQRRATGCADQAETGKR